MNDRYSGLERTALTGASSPVHTTNGNAAPGRIKVAQAQLKAHGVDPGHPPNGQLTAGTTRAITAFQVTKGLTPTGTLDARTTSALNRPPKTAGRTVGSRRMKGGPVLVKRPNLGERGNKAPSTTFHGRAGGGQPHAQARSGANHTTSAIGISLGGSRQQQQHQTAGGSTMKGQSEWESAGKRVPIIFQSNGTVAAAATATIQVQPQLDFRGENFVVDATTGAFFSVVSFKVGVPDQNAGGSGNIPCSIFSPTQNGAIDYEMDLANSGTIIQLTVINNDTVAHAFIGTLWGHEIQQS